MGGYVCRFCNIGSESNNGFVSLELSIRNRKLIVYVCQDCYCHLTGSAIIRCQYCGDMWVRKDAAMGRGFWNVTRCTRCREADTESVTRIGDLCHTAL